MTITAWQHAAVICSDYERSKRFYVETLGLTIIAETRRADRQSWKLDLAIPGGGQIELFSFPDPTARPSHPEACGISHSALKISTPTCGSSKQKASRWNRFASTNSPAAASPFSPIPTVSPSSSTRPLDAGRSSG